ncbi:helix-turn-helix transcriptional regulator [Escherichia coli]|nr:transcriptional regulator [Salmonella enterica subsp. enterica serovar Paratyphi A]EFG9153063.1 helix-turn-helix transcriptional regulator [Escherichia coli]
MTDAEALAAFGALSQETRLRILKMLVRAGPEGMSAGSLGEAVGVASSGMSFHLNHLEQARLVQSRREGRFIIYTAALEALSGLIAFLMADCCQGRPEICAPAVAALSCGCEG